MSIQNTCPKCGNISGNINEKHICEGKVTKGYENKILSNLKGVETK